MLIVLLHPLLTFDSFISIIEKKCTRLTYYLTSPTTCKVGMVNYTEIHKWKGEKYM